MTAAKTFSSIAAASTFALITSGCMTTADLPTERVASARLTMANGVPAGTAQLHGSGDNLSLTLVVTGIEPGPHGFHLHEVGDCRRPDFTSAGGHLNPLGKHHGRLDPGGSHLGDLPNLEVGQSRTASTTVDLAGTRSQVMDWLFDADGTAVVIHSGPDDYRSDPSGDAGSRIACGVLRQS